MNIGYVTTELSPFAKVGGLADVSNGLPIALSSLGEDLTIFMPLYGTLDKRELKIRKYPKWKDITITIDNIRYELTLFKKKLNKKVTILFLYNEKLFNRDGIYTDKEGKGYEDNHIRDIFLSKGVLKVIKKLELNIDILHLNDSHTALIAPYLKTQYCNVPFLKDIKTVLTIHNLGSAYQGIHEAIEIKHAGLSYDYHYLGGPFEYHGKFNFLKAGIIYSDMVTTVSPKYAKEIQTEEFGEGLDGVLKNSNKLVGILNGIETDVWDPKTDKYLVANFNCGKTLKNKFKNKLALLEEFGLTNESAPLIAMISRLTEQKGFELLKEKISELMKLDLNLIILGTGEKRYEDMLKDFMEKYPKKISIKLKYSEKLAHQIEAGADIFLMPSKYEPCGLNQFYSMRYGTVPIVHSVGGLEDSILDYLENKKDGTGFKFYNFDSNSMLKTIKDAISIYKNRKEWKKIMLNGMKSDFSWKNSAKKYLEIYKSLV